MNVVNDKRSKSVLFLDELLQVIIYGDTHHPSNYFYYNDALNLLFLLFQGQQNHIHDPDNESDFFLQQTIKQMGLYGNRFISRMLRNFVEKQKSPTTEGLFMSAYSYLFASTGNRYLSKESFAFEETGICQKSLLLLLLLSCQTFHQPNRYSDAISMFQSLQGIIAFIRNFNHFITHYSRARAISYIFQATF
jgi:hypothetical protein